MSNTELFTIEQVAEALRNAAGIRSAAAQQLDCSPTTITNYIERHPELAAVEHEAIETRLDLAESKLLSNIKDGKEASIFFFLKCKGKHRGYVERQEITGAGGGPLDFVVNMTPEDRQARIDELLAQRTPAGSKKGKAHGSSKPSSRGRASGASRKGKSRKS